MGIELDIGTLPDADDLAQGQTADPERLANVTARIVARAADRFTFVRKLSRHFEGEDKRAGILSDLVSAAWLLYRRNPAAIESLLQQGARLAKEARDQKTSNGKNVTNNGGTPS
jgi:hypothetical protein